jgi:hypothetical protein
MTYELWQSDEAWTFFPAAKPYMQQRKFLEETATLEWSVEAGSYNEAMKLYYDHMGWKDYLPMEEGTHD